MKLFEIYNNQNQTLLEYNAAATLKRWGERLGQAAKFNWRHLNDMWWNVNFQDSMEVDYEEFFIQNDDIEAIPALANVVLRELERIDPTPNKQYVQTLARWYVGNIEANKRLEKAWQYNLDVYGAEQIGWDDWKDWAENEEYDPEDDPDEDFEPFRINPENLDTFKLEDSDQIRTALVNYDRMKPQLHVSERDIGKFKTFYEFEDFVDSKMDPELKQELENELLNRPDVDVLYNGPLGTVAVPRTEEASCLLGRGTKWCTAGKTNNLFKEYAAGGDLMIYNEKPGNAKYQIYVSLEGLQMMDSRDRVLSYEKHSEFVNSHPVISKLIKQKELEIYSELAKKTWEPGDSDRTLGYPYDNESNLVTLLIDRNRDWQMGPMNFVETFYLNFFLSDPVFQKKLPTRAEIGFLDSYALQRKKPWPEMEKKIVAYMTNAVNLYAKNLKFHNASGDAILLGRLIKYFKEIKEPWPELDKLDEVLKTVYLRDVLERPNWQKEIETYYWGTGPMNE